MLRLSLANLLSDNAYYTLKNRWAIPVPDLVRTFFFDRNDNDFGYVVSYSEKKQEYILRKVALQTGGIVWETKVVNGGYGTPVVYGNLIIMLRSFDSIVGINKDTGKEKFYFDYNNRIRTYKSFSCTKRGWKRSDRFSYSWSFFVWYNFFISGYHDLYWHQV